MSKEERSERVGEFINKHGLACGGEWSQMAMSAIRRGLPDIFKKMKDKEYDFFELLEIIADNIIEVR